MPGALSRSIAEHVAVRVARLPRLDGRRAIVARHLQRVVGPELAGAALDRMVDDTFASYARYWAESLRLPGLTAAEVDAGMSFRGIDEIDAARDGGRGVILALPHLGGWEWGGTWMARIGHPITVVVEELHPPEVFEWFVSFRRRLGMEVVAAGPHAAAAVLRALRSNRVLCLLSDRLIGDTAGVDVEFFGERTRLPSGPVTLALRTGAPLLPCAVYFGAGADEHLAVVRRPLAVARQGRLGADVAAGTQHLAQELEALIRQAPTQWHLLQPNWPSDRAE